MKLLVFGICLALFSIFSAVDANAAEDVFAPPHYCGKVWVEGHYNKHGKWIKPHWKHQYWVEGHYNLGKWVPGHCR